MDRLYYETLTVPAGTPIATPASQAWPLEDNELVKVTIQVPDGHCGLTGFRILRAQQQIVPFANNSYLVANDRTLDYPFDDQITTTGLVLEGYNNDIFPHTFYVTALVTNLTYPAENPPAAVTTPGALSLDTSLTDDGLTPDSILTDDEFNAIPDDENSIPPPTAPQPVKLLPRPITKKPVKRTPPRKIGPVRR